MSALREVRAKRTSAGGRAPAQSIRVLSVAALVTGTLALTVSVAPAAGAATPVITAVTAGWNHTCALTSTGGVKCWGANDFGQLGDGTTTPRSTPVDVVGLTSGVVAIAAGGQRTCALTSAGGVKCWGSNVFGGVGDGTTVDRLTPVDVSGLTSGVASIAAGAFHTCAVTTGGAAKCWGGNEFGELGNGTTIASVVPVDVVGLSSGVVAITAGGRQTCVVTTAGAAKCWGHNASGQLGDGGGYNRSTPVDVAGLSSGVVDIAAGGRHTCAETSTGGLKCWGRNDFGQVGDGTETDRITPVDVQGYGTGTAEVATGRWHTCGLTTAGAVRCWGDVTGDGDVGDPHTLTPTAVVGLGSGVVSIAAGEGHTCAVMSNGGVRCFGNNVDGKLGNGTTAVSSSAVDVIFGDAPALAATSTTLGSSPNPSNAGQSVTFTATVTSGSGTPAGTVTFREGSTVLGTAPLSGGSAFFTTSSLTSGSHPVTAQYGGDATFSGSTSAAVTQVVNAPTTVVGTTTSLTTSPNPSNAGQPVTLTATVRPSSGSGVPTGSVLFRRGRVTLATVNLSNGTASFTTSDLPLGTSALYATYLGSSAFSSSSSPVVTQTVNSSSGPPALRINDVSVVEGFDGTVSATFTISLSAPSASTVTVSAVTHDVTATALKDYAPKSATVSFSPGQTTKTMVVGVKGDVRDEPNETFTFDLSSPTNAIIADGQGVGTIIDDD